MSEDLDVSIQRKEAELQPLRQRMEELRVQFISDTVKFAAKWFEETAQLYVTKKPEVTINMSKERLADMKQKVINLTKNADTLITKVLSGANLWWHQDPRKEDSIYQYQQVSTRFPELLDKPIRRALGELGVILEQYDYGVTVGIYAKESYMEYWYERPPDSAPTTAPHPYFPHLLVWSDEMQHTMTQYDAIYKQAFKLFIEIQKLKEEKKRLQASALWNST
jgi:predicted DNA binding CopG/RHH family protein